MHEIVVQKVLQLVQNVVFGLFPEREFFAVFEVVFDEFVVIRELFDLVFVVFELERIGDVGHVVAFWVLARIRHLLHLKIVHKRLQIVQIALQIIRALVKMAVQAPFRLFQHLVVPGFLPGEPQTDVRLLVGLLSLFVDLCEVLFFYVGGALLVLSGDGDRGFFVAGLDFLD